MIASVTPVCLKDTEFPWQQRPVTFWESDPKDSLFLPVPSCLLLRLPPHIQEAITKAHETMAHPNKDLGMPWPLDDPLPSALELSGYIYMQPVNDLIAQLTYVHR